MSMQRIDYYDSPEAPRANRLVPAVNVVVVNHAGAILLIRRTDNGPGNRTPWLHDGPVDAHPHQRLPGTQPVPGDHLIPRDDGQRRSSRAPGHGAQPRSGRPPPRGEGQKIESGLSLPVQQRMQQPLRTPGAMQPFSGVRAVVLWTTEEVA